MRFHVTGSASGRPVSHGTVFCDGYAGRDLRAGEDIELSHWIPNRTPWEFRADSSTEICMKFVAGGVSKRWDLAVNNHVDVDGVLSMFTVVHPENALAHRETLIGAAEMGDFAAWADAPSQALFQGLTLLIDECKAASVDPVETYRRAFAAVPPLLAPEAAASPRVLPGLHALAESVTLLDSGAVRVRDHGPRLASYEIPRDVSRDDFARALHVPEFNEALSAKALVWPQARARDRETAVHLVSVGAADGWYHDVWYPGYAWADTVERPVPRGVVRQGAGLSFWFPPLEAAINGLRSVENGAGTWKIASSISAFDGLAGRGFPVVASFVGEGDRPAASSIPPADVAARLAPAFA